MPALGALSLAALGALTPMLGAAHAEQVQKSPVLTGGEEEGEGQFGRGVALSADGNTALVAGPYDGEGAGAAWVFTRSGSTWTQQAKLTGGEEVGKAYFGRSVALSADGDTAVIGGPNDRYGVGAAWVFTRSGSTWTQQAKLSGGEEVGTAHFGRSVTVSGDGDTAVIGGPADNEKAGAAWVFTRSGSTWEQEGLKLSGGGEEGAGFFGEAVALSADGDTAVIGGPEDGNGTGAVWVFARPSSPLSTWTQEGAKLTGGGEEGEGSFGQTVALSAEGDTALLGGLTDDGGIGAAWVFTRSGSAWTQQGHKLISSGGRHERHFSSGVALSATGNTALVGDSAANGKVGGAWVFTRSGSAWSQLGFYLTGGEEEIGEGQFGRSVALSADGETALIGALGDERELGAGRTGAAWVFVGPPELSEPPEEVKRHEEEEAKKKEEEAEEHKDAVEEEEARKQKEKEEEEEAKKPPSEPPPKKEQPLGNGQTAKGEVLAVTEQHAVISASIGSLQLAGTRIVVTRSGRAAIRLTCTGAHACSGRLALAVKTSAKTSAKNARSKKGKPRSKTIVIGKTTAFTIPAGRTSTVTLVLNGSGRSLLRAGRGRLTVALTLVRLLPGPPETHTATVHLVLQSAHKTTKRKATKPKG